MKKLSILLPLFALMFLPTLSNAQDVFRPGDREVFISGNLDTDSYAGADLDVQLGYGWFMAPLVEAGIKAGIEDNDIIGAWNVALFAEYNYDTGRYWIPYGGFDFGYRALESDRVDIDESGVELGLYIGLKYLFPGAENISWFGQVGVGLSTDEIYDTEDGSEDSDVQLRMGLRYLLPGY